MTRRIRRLTDDDFGGLRDQFKDVPDIIQRTKRRIFLVWSIMFLISGACSIAAIYVLIEVAQWFSRQ